ncbi:hypothetical protein EDC96DRAFT_561152 [Choanephora cucurbitarum]|nr:hypothetical protein EDC96DRAFT_561152 [Choanephora cucurbitarum]
MKNADLRLVHHPEGNGYHNLAISCYSKDLVLEPLGSSNTKLSYASIVQWALFDKGTRVFGCVRVSLPDNIGMCHCSIHSGNITELDDSYVLIGDRFSTATAKHCSCSL